MPPCSMRSKIALILESLSHEKCVVTLPFSGKGERFFQILAGPNNGSAHRYALQYRFHSRELETTGR